MPSRFYLSAEDTAGDLRRLPADVDIFDYIESFYNRACRHSHLGGVKLETF